MPPPPPPAFDPAALGAAFGADLQSAMAAALAQGLDSSTMAQLNAIAQLNQLANNQKLAAAMLQQQQQQQHFLGSSSNPLAAAVAVAAAAAAASSSPSHHNNMGLPSHLMGSNAIGNSGSSGQMSGAGNVGSVKMNQTRYQQLLGLVDEMGREIRSTYVGNKNSMERLKRGIASARILVKDCQLECERNMKQ